MTQLLNVLFFCRSRPKRIFWYLSQHISWEKIICQPQCVSQFPYMSVYVRWHLIIDVCKPRSFWSPSTWNPVACWCFVEFSIVRFVMKPSGLYGQPVFGGEKKEHNFTFMWQLHCAIYTIELSSVHTLCPPELVSFFCFFDCCWLQQKTLELQKPYPFSKLGFPPVHQPPWNCWENSAKRKKQLLNCACSKLY